MHRQPLIRKYPDAGFQLGSDSLEQRPHAAARIAQCIALWSDVDFQTARLFAALMGATNDHTVSVFLALRSARVQKQILHAAAKSTLTTPRDVELFNAYLDIA